MAKQDKPTQYFAIVSNGYFSFMKKQLSNAIANLIFSWR